MSRDSVAVMTSIDVVLIATMVILIFTMLRLRTPAERTIAISGITITITGLTFIGLLYLTDLLSMHILPWFIGAPEAAAIVTIIRLEVQWVVILVSMPLICTGFVLGTIERRRSVRSLQQREERYRSIVHDQIDMIARWRPDGTITWVNQPYCRYFGVLREEVVGRNFFGKIVDLNSLLKKRDALTPESPVYTNQNETGLPNGGTRWQEWVTRGLFDASGKLIELQSIGRDITNRLQTSRALQDSEARFRGFVENTPDFVWETDTNMRYTYCNGQVRNLLGYEPTEVRNQPATDFVLPDTLEEYRTKQPQLLTEKTGWRNVLVKFRHRNGSIRYVESSADPMLDATGNLIGYRGVDRDRTFQTLMMELSLELVGCHADEVSDKVDQSLDQIGQSYALDRISILRLRGDMLYRDAEWARKGFAADCPASIEIACLPRAQKEMFDAGRAYVVPSTDNLPSGSAEREFLEAQNISSAVCMPLQHEGTVVAIASCTTVGREQTWTDDTEDELRLLLEKLTDAKRQAESTISIARREKDLTLSEELALVGSYAFYIAADSGEFPNGWAAHFSTEQCSLLEIQPNEASYALFVSRIHEDDRARIEAALAALVDHGTRFEQEFRFRNPIGHITHIASRAEIEMDRSGSISRVVGSCRNISEQVNREEALVAALGENEMLRDRLQEENVQLREEIQSFTEFEQIIGETPELRASLNLAARAARTNTTILILGETGTGKELVAKAIHQLSARSDKRLVSINCTALPETLIESELFGHEKGAFTGASERRAGRFEHADGGTLFLDEIGDLPLGLQGKLLRVLEHGGFERLGGSETIHPDVRLIAATNRNLEAAVQKGRFRADLYYRINTVPIELPPLRERRQDIPMLAQHFVDKHRERLGKSVIAISSRMIEFLLNQDWPGNVRELEHFIERSLISATGKVLSMGERPALIAAPVEKLNSDRPTKLKAVEREHILRVLNDTGWVIDGAHGAATILGLAPSTLRSRMKRLGIARSAEPRAGN